MSHTFTHIKEPDCDLDIWQCDDCGAYADKREDIEHFDTCVFRVRG